ncbi:MAG TPA: type II 3-dehydroquinate dehydratase [Candidatus Krumholzibacteria bacterium]|nr:type II 3-dehydroquinate dehydratase [Candidatus Krumholzibacteria bacterium]
MNVLILHGPNLNLLGSRQPEIYGDLRLTDLESRLVHVGVELGVEVDGYQSNHEGELIDRIHGSNHIDGFVVNAGGLTHSSVSLRDAFLAMDRPLVEVHASNLARREDFRQRSLLSDIAVGTVAGFGIESYELGLRGLVHVLRDRRESGGPQA